jgi:uncharacterized protein
MKTILLLTVSNIFMTAAWYGHLKYGMNRPFFEYCAQVPANRLGYGEFTGFQLKIIQEVITLVIFTVFAMTVLGEKLRWNYVLSFVFILLAVVSAFYKTSSGSHGG